MRLHCSLRMPRQCEVRHWVVGVEDVIPPDLDSIRNVGKCLEAYELRRANRYAAHTAKRPTSQPHHRHAAPLHRHRRLKPATLRPICQRALATRVKHQQRPAI